MITDTQRLIIKTIAYEQILDIIFYAKTELNFDFMKESSFLTTMFSNSWESWESWVISMEVYEC